MAAALRCGRGARAFGQAGILAASRRAPGNPFVTNLRGRALPLLPSASTCRDCRFTGVRAEFSGLRNFHSSRRKSSEDKDKDKEEGKVDGKRLPSDDPSQLPGHFFKSASWFTPRKTSLNPIAGFFVRANTYALEKLSEGNFVQDEFLSGCRLSFEMVMKCFASGSVDDVAACMTERMKNGFQQTLDEYKAQGLVLDYEIAPVASAEIISIRFFVDEMGNDRVHVDVEFEGKQKFTLRDCSNRAVGEEGDWQDKSSVWRFESPLPELKWELVDLP